MNGNDILIYKNGVAIAAAVSCDTSGDADMLEVSDPNSGKYKKYVSDLIGWTITVNCLFLSAARFKDEFLTLGNEFVIKRAGRDGTGALQGNAFLKTCRETATRGNLVQGSFVFQGSGPLTQITSP